MTKVACVAAFVAAILVVPDSSVAASSQGGTPQDICRSRAQEILAALQDGNYAAATTHFDSRMAAQVGADKLKQIWGDMLPTQFGAFVHAADTIATSRDGAILTETPLQFARGWLAMRVTCDTTGSIGGLFFAPGAAPLSLSAPTTANTTASHHEQTVAVPSPFGPLAGTLALPAGDGPYPAVLLVAGSGPNDRDESIGPNKPFADIARSLAERGIASLRYDKRTLTYGAKVAGSAITIDDEVTDDALAALKLLTAQPRVDRTRIFVLGHSLGAMMAPRIVARGTNVAGAILLAAPVTLDLDTVLRQTRYIAGVQHASAQQLEAALAPLTAARDVIASADPHHPPAGEFFHAPASYWLSLRGYRPIEVARALKQPLLILQGSGDYQVTPDGDFVQWQAAFTQRHDVVLKQYAGLNHLFMPAGDPPSPADYAKAGHVDAHVTGDIAAWVLAQPQQKQVTVD